MKRRDLLKLTALTAGAVTLKAAPAHALLAPELAPPTPEQVTNVLMVSLCHLDVGFSKTQAQILRLYFDTYYPQAIATAASLRASGSAAGNTNQDRYTWTTAAWLLYEYLQQATPEQRHQAEQAIAAGDLAWHALPFNWETEMIDPSMMDGLLHYSRTLDARFGKKTIGGKMSDVPGHTRGIIAPLAAAGVRLLDIGVNAASTAPEVPDIFLWRDPNGASIVMLYHHLDYGGTILIPGTTTAIAMEVRNDNSGPHTPTEIAATYARLRQQFPNAAIRAANMSEVAAATDPIRDRLPIVTREIGDTWIYGVPSDPPKVAQYREVSRLRQQWIAQNKFAAGDATDLKFLSRFSLAIEHTWGTDTKSYLDNDHYKPDDLAQVVDTKPYQTMTFSWQEKRDDITEGINALPTPLRDEAREHIARLTPQIPSHEGLTPLTPQTEVTTKHYTIAFDSTGAITRLKDLATSKEWASKDHPLALFTYQTLSEADFAQYLETYVRIKADWAPRDFGKPNIGHFGAISRDWHPTVVQAWSGETTDAHRILLQLRIDDDKTAATGLVAWPKTMYLELLLAHEEPSIDLNFTSFGKQENRLPEALWLTFNPTSVSATPNPDAWLLEKSGQTLHPTDVVRGGARSMHAITEKITYTEAQNTLKINTLDAPVVALGSRTPLNFSLDPPTLTSGIHFSLFNNAWGTNYIQWCGGDWQYRFTLRT